MILLGLYIEGVKADVFKDSSVQIKDSIKKSTDIATVRTAYTNQFTLPASKTNNKIFKHYYNVVVEDGFDSRRKHSATITLNGSDYKKGYLKLNGVDIKNGKAYAYRVQFFGEISSLKDVLAEDKIEDLTALSAYNHSYNITNVRAGFEDYVQDFTSATVLDVEDVIIYPFITHTRGFKYDSNGLYDVTQASTPALTDRLDHSDLKPAIKVKTILDAIGTKYGFTFAGKFIDGDMFNNLYLWLHREKGNLKNSSDAENLNYWKNLKDGNGENEYELASGDEQRPLITWNYRFGTAQKYDITYEVDTVDSGNYTMVLTAIPSNGGTPLVELLENQNGTTSMTMQLTSRYPTGWEVITQVYADNTIGSIDNTVTVDRLDKDDTIQDTGVYEDTSYSLIVDFITNANLPKMKCIDFIRSIFKMFNLVAYDRVTNHITGAYEIVLQTLDDYYNNGSAVDITKYIDISSSSVERVQPYHLLKFEYPEPSTFLAINTNEINRTSFGNAVFNTQDLLDGDDSYLFDGGEYAVEVPLEKMVYERIRNGSTDALTEIQWGWMVNDFSENEPEPELGKPLFFFRNNRSCSTDVIKWSDDTNTNTTYNAPSNVMPDDSQTLNFSAEIDEYTLEVNENSLFANYYANLIRGVYDLNARRIKVNAYLPPKFIFNYKLNDKLIINAVAFNIEDITIDLLTGHATLELLKLTGRQEVYDIQYGKCYAEMDYVDLNYWCRAYTRETR